MKVLYIITQAVGGGAQNYTLDLAKNFNGALAAGAEDEKLFITAQRAGLATFPLKHLRRAVNPLHDFLAMWEIRQLIKTYNPDIIHLNSSKAGVLGSFAAIGLKKKVIFTAHGFVFDEPLPMPTKTFYLALEKIASDYRDYIITVSDADKNSALKNSLIAANKIATIHNGLDEIKFLDKQAARTALGLHSDKIIIGCVANFYKSKGVDVLLEAVAMISSELRQKIQVALIGDGPEKEDLKLRIANYQLGSTIKMLGKIDNAAEYLKAFDCLVMPSRKEGFPYSLLEAMQAGLPIVAANVGGISEALGEAGFLIRAEDPKELATVISQIIKDLNTHGINYFADLSQKAKSRAKLFTREKMLSETKKVYDLVLGK